MKKRFSLSILAACLLTTSQALVQFLVLLVKFQLATVALFLAKA